MARIQKSSDCPSGPDASGPAENADALGPPPCLTPGEVWSERVNIEIAALSATQQRLWNELFAHLQTATASRPSQKWMKTAAQKLEAIGAEAVLAGWLRWLPLIAHGRTYSPVPALPGEARGIADSMIEANETVLRGMLWMTPLFAAVDAQQELPCSLAAVALSAFKKIPGIGPRSAKVGNSAVQALAQLQTTAAVGQLAMLKMRVKQASAQKELEKALTTAAGALGLKREEIEELAVPSFGLDSLGQRGFDVGDYQASLTVTGSSAVLLFQDASGKPLKAVPARLKKERPLELKELRQSHKDIQRMLSAQKERLDGLFLKARAWPFEAWRERYLQHPLVGAMARRLIWCIDGTPAVFSGGEPQDLQGRTIEHGRTAEITLWHPIGRPVDEVLAWRRRLEELPITQPFKQAHRELYLLTDAERRTHTYSNRFAAHVLRQHQFNALCAVRGWKNSLRLMVDAFFEPPHKILPEWGLRAEFWVEGIGDDYGSDTNDAGVFLRVATDQVRFYPIESVPSAAHASGGGYLNRNLLWNSGGESEPLPLDLIPPIVFSEIMRDVDLFVGVASVGNDPSWQDGGPEGRYLDYWQSYSFGELSGSAATRKQVLERLVPRLKIADRCTFSERFLVVRGDLRTYKIHLGSGNILMEPNDQYLCIVPDSKSRSPASDLHLPFEGDSMLSIILSKALLLAADAKISDPTITRQLQLV